MRVGGRDGGSPGPATLMESVRSENGMLEQDVDKAGRQARQGGGRDGAGRQETYLEIVCSRAGNRCSLPTSFRT